MAHGDRGDRMVALRDKVAAVVARNAGSDASDLVDATRLEDLDIDSLTLAETVIELEEVLDLELPDEDVEHARTFGDVLRAVERAMG